RAAGPWRPAGLCGPAQSAWNRGERPAARRAGHRRARRAEPPAGHPLLQSPGVLQPGARQRPIRRRGPLHPGPAPPGRALPLLHHRPGPVGTAWRRSLADGAVPALQGAPRSGAESGHGGGVIGAWKLQVEVAGRFRLILHRQQGQLEYLAAGGRPVDVLADGHAEQRGADRCQYRDGTFLAGILGEYQRQVIILATAFFAAMNAGVHRHHASRQLLTSHHLRPRKLLLERLGRRTVLSRAIEQSLKSLQILLRNDDRRCTGHGVWLAPGKTGLRKRRNPARRRGFYELRSDPITADQISKWATHRGRSAPQR